MNFTSILPCWPHNQTRSKQGAQSKPSTEELRRELAKLRQSLQDAEGELAELAEDLEYAIERNDLYPTRKWERKFNDALLRIETRHPHLTAALSTVSTMLADLGI